MRMVSKSCNKSPYGSTDRGVLQAIGLAVVNFSQLEETLVLGVRFLIVGTLDDEAADLTVRKLSFRDLVEALAGLYRHRFPDDDFGDLKEVCLVLDKLNNERNHLFHSSWSSGKAANQLRRYKAAVRRGGPKIWDQNVSEGDVLRFAEGTDQALGRLVGFLMESIVPRIDDVVAHV